MQVTFIDESRRQARQRVERILDRYLHRIAHDTWRGQLSAEGLRVVSEQLKARASRHTAVACYIDGRSPYKPAFHIGSRRGFNASGHYAIRARRSSARGATYDTPAWRQLHALLELTGLVHDIGKAAIAFQEKIRATKSTIADPARHELLSTLFLVRARANSSDDRELLKRLAKANADDFEALYEQAAADTDEVINTERLPDLGWDANRPVTSSLILLVATHHLLLDAELTSAEVHFKPTAHINPKAAEERKNGTGTKHANYASLFRDNNWLRAIKRAAGSLESLVTRDAWAVSPQTLYAYGRLLLMLGDHYATAQGTQRSGCDHHQLFANTGREPETGETWLAEPLPDHLRAVARTTRRFAQSLRRAQNHFPYVDESELPSTLTAPSAEGRFGWQGDAVQRVHDASAAPHGFFGVMTVSTGGGKTRGCPAVLQAAAGRCRFFLGLGLRTLALQSGDEYAGEVGFKPWHMATLVGDEATRGLHGNVDVAGGDDSLDISIAWGSDAAVQDLPEAVVAPDRGDGYTQWHQDPTFEPSSDALGALGGGPGHEPNSGALPAIVESALMYAHDRRADTMLRTPVLSATLDQIMAAADARRGSHLFRMLRLATSDLILDEVDCYDVEDLAAIARLVFLAGAFGRKVVIASATVPPAAARSLFANYYAGWQAYAELTGARSTCLAGWFSEHTALTKVEPHSPETFGDSHNAVTKATVEALDGEQPQRSVTLLTPNERSEQAAHEAITDEAQRMHQRHSLTHDGITLSVGVVRFSHIRSCRAYATHLLSVDCPDTQIGVVCYHSRLLTAVRFDTERRLHRMLQRKGDDPDASVLAEPAVQGLIDQAKAHGRTQVMIVVVVSPVEETGRDHDFDYAIIEPSTVRSLIQLAGRVRRHRPGAPSGPNCALLNAPLNYYRGDQPPYYRNPGVETDLDAPYLDPAYLGESQIANLLDTEALADRLDARLSLIEPDDERNRLATEEHALLRRSLEQGPYPAKRFSTDPNLPFATWMPTNRRFRRGYAMETVYCAIDAFGEQAWHIIDSRGMSRPITEHVTDERSDQPAQSPSQWLFDLEPPDLLDRYAPRFGNSSQDRLCRLLLSANIHLSTSDTLHHEPHQGLDRSR